MDIGSIRRVIEVDVQPAPTLAVLAEQPDLEEIETESEER
jgi:hypothetical protein